ncbi:MAG: type II toxin-antitoxin system RelE/ParE family toxin [Sedimentisphaerales bacterium]|nr:type II toxin-antitoxin system RelE/ParE family toxin [Sedimentisphaerales bacterium]
MSGNPRPHNCIKMQGGRNLWRMRVGNYRIIYSINDNAKSVDIITIRHRRDAYK